jgi:hypothetical protein
MNRYDLKFMLNSTDKIIIKLKEPLAEVDCCYMADMILEYEQQKILLSREPIFFNMQKLAELLEEALNNKLFLHVSINNDIGYLSNEYYQHRNNIVMNDVLQESLRWIGFTYYLWEGSKKNTRYVTWLYNDDNGENVLEVTPAYPYLFCDPDKEPHYVSYEEWIKNYKPFLNTIIPKKIAQDWLEQAHCIVEQIKANIARWEKEEEISA